MAAKAPARDTSIAIYRARRDFTATAEPAPPESVPGDASAEAIFVVQKHDATRLHWDFRLEHGGVLWSWAVPRGPSLDPHDKRLAVHVEDHPIPYAEFHGAIPEGQYGAGTVETWDRGTWRPLGEDAAADLARGELKFELAGTRLHGKFVLIRLKPRPREHAENWLLIKEHDQFEREGIDAAALEAEIPLPVAGAPTPEKLKLARKKADKPHVAAPTPGAVRGKLPATQAPQLAELVSDAPAADEWISEIKFDGYRVLAFVAGGVARLITRNGHDWTPRLPALAASIAALGLGDALLDGELVALDAKGVSSFNRLQDALSRQRDDALVFYVFDLLHLDGWDLRPCRLVDRKARLRALSDWTGQVRYSDHLEGEAVELHLHACKLHLEGIICKRGDAPYRAGRGRDWVKVKCQGREEFVVVGWTAPKGSRSGIGALRVAYFDPAGGLHYAGGVGGGFSEKELAAWRKRLEPLAAERPAGMAMGTEPVDRLVRWVRPELVVEAQYLDWTDDGRLRHATYLGLREDKPAEQVVRPVAGTASIELPAAAKPAAPARVRITVARAPDKPESVVEGVRLSHPDRALWTDTAPDITKADLAAYWQAVAPYALPEIAHRPLALVRCPDGVAGEHFFQKHPSQGFPAQLHSGEADGAPYLALDDAGGLIAATQMSAVELHAWGATLDDPLHPDRLVFDLDPGDGVGMAEMAAAAFEVRGRLEKLGIASFCRTSGGKGLHVVASLRPSADWVTARGWCRAFAELMAADSPGRYVAAVKKSIRNRRILVDWLRNGLGSTAIASFSPRSRPGAGVATRLAWREVTPKLDVSAHTMLTVPARLKRQKADPWADFAAAAVPLPVPNRKS